MIFLLPSTLQVLIVLPYRVNNVRQLRDNDLQHRDNSSISQVHQVPDELG